MSNIRLNPALLVLKRPWSKTSAPSNTYLSGQLGAMRVLVMENHDHTGDGDATHLLMVAEAGRHGGAK